LVLLLKPVTCRIWGSFVAVYVYIIANRAFLVNQKKCCIFTTLILKYYWGDVALDPAGTQFCQRPLPRDH